MCGGCVHVCVLVCEQVSRLLSTVVSEIDKAGCPVSLRDPLAQLPQLWHYRFEHAAFFPVVPEVLAPQLLILTASRGLF